MNLVQNQELENRFLYMQEGADVEVFTCLPQFESMKIYKSKDSESIKQENQGFHHKSKTEIEFDTYVSDEKMKNQFDNRGKALKSKTIKLQRQNHFELKDKQDSEGNSQIINQNKNFQTNESTITSSGVNITKALLDTNEVANSKSNETNLKQKLKIMFSPRWKKQDQNIQIQDFQQIKTSNQELDDEVSVQNNQNQFKNQDDQQNEQKNQNLNNDILNQKQNMTLQQMSSQQLMKDYQNSQNNQNLVITNGLEVSFNRQNISRYQELNQNSKLDNSKEFIKNETFKKQKKNNKFNLMFQQNDFYNKNDCNQTKND
ncbi:hypothetical protein PPERSA_00841 [Pseudocohnilembus persalinus]|uniref:Uncharacterized protein n=1 Tax=Pseudocohnilembus persalinus TaxID=266149 RepID=A0A0V0R7A6_PSEPJ|nr:hypothetical protein PPERSA_00841 [Pseudocohnilembus persalinus]|eukprot:KRX10361.1 hypothetical protein PPERSA_00841 [Pseudocohnilembus persalinus]